MREAQGYAAPSPIGQLVRDHTQLGNNADAAAITHYFYHHKEPNRDIAGLAPAILSLAEDGEPLARELVLESTGELLTLATAVATKHFPNQQISHLRAGLSGPI